MMNSGATAPTLIESEPLSRKATQVASFRSAVLAASIVPGAPARESLNRIARLASRLLSATAVVAVVDQRGGLSESLGDHPVSPLAMRVLTEALPLVVHDTRQIMDCPVDGMEGRAFLGVPIWVEDMVVGTLCAEAAEPRTWAEDDVQALEEFSELAASEISARLQMLESAPEEKLTDGGQKDGESARAVEKERRLRAKRQLARAQRLESVGTLASGLAHDLNNILAPIMMSAPLLRTELPRQDREELLTTIERSAERAAVVIRQVLTFARGMDGEREIIRPKDILNEASRVISAIFPRNIRVQMMPGAHLHRLPGDVGQLNRVLLNLCLNARDAMPEGGTLTVVAENCEVDAELAAEMPGLKAGSYVRFRVKDSGTGIPASVFEHIFDPFFTTKPLGKGAGLGLSSALGIVRSHHGFIDVRTVMGQGTVFDVYLPACASEAPAAVVEQPVMQDGRGELVLIVDDEKEILSSTASALGQRGYRTLTAADGTEALALFAQHHREINLVLTDVMMPVVDGVALCRALRKMAPKVPIVATTGMGDEARLKELRAVSLSGVISKPYGTDMLLGTLQNALKTERSVSQAA